MRALAGPSERVSQDLAISDQIGAQQYQQEAIEAQQAMYGGF